MNKKEIGSIRIRFVDTIDKQQVIHYQQIALVCRINDYKQPWYCIQLMQQRHELATDLEKVGYYDTKSDDPKKQEAISLRLKHESMHLEYIRKK